MMPQCAMQKRVSMPRENALDNAGNSRPTGSHDDPKSLIYWPILAHFKRKPRCEFTMIATPT
jgi:hypothetical protein